VIIGDDEFVKYNCHHCNWCGNSPPYEGERKKPMKKFVKKAVYRKPDVSFADPDEKFYDWISSTRKINKIIAQQYNLTVCTHFMPQTGQDTRVIAFPYYLDGTLINVKYRGIKEKIFAMEKDAQQIWYGLDFLKSHDTVIITEGEWDTLSFVQAGFQSCISVPAGASRDEETEGDPTPDNDHVAFSYIWECRDRLAHVKRFVIATDGDGRGNTLANELARRLGKARCKRVIWPTGCKDASDVLVKHGSNALKECVVLAEPYPLEGVYTMSDYFAQALDRYKGKQHEGFSTGWSDLDEIVRIVTPSLYLITGIPNHGKSLFVDCLCYNMARLHGWKTAYCSFETPPDLHALLLAAKFRDRPVFNQAYEKDTYEIESALMEVGESFLWIRSDNESPTPEWILARAGEAVERYGIRILVVDPWNEIEHHRRRDESETEYVSRVLQMFRRFANERDVCFILVAHPTKLRDNDGQQAVAGMYDVSGSANFANKPDIFLTVVRNKGQPPTTTIACKKARWDWIAKCDEQRTLWYKESSKMLVDAPLPYERL
jgi:twinkle protein